MTARGAFVRRLCAALLLSLTGAALGACELLTSLDYTKAETNPCPDGQTLCNDGNCFDLKVTPQHCGACGHVCASGSMCVAAACVCQDPSTTLCTLGCFDLESDPSNCGACGKQCPSLFCVGGQCGPALCSTPRITCGSACVDVSNDTQNCGTCGRRCFGTCFSGLCISEPADAAFDVAADANADADADGAGDASDAEASTDASDAGRGGGKP
jgi:hypothetical protein